MKPKNRVMCPDCGRSKMLFETEKKAENFLKFNGNEVNPKGDRTMRVYYCPACCGYHISSHVYKGDNTKTDKLIEAYKRDLKAKDTEEQSARYQEFLKTAREEYQYMVEHGYTKDEARRHMHLFSIPQRARQIALQNYYQYLAYNRVGQEYKYNENILGNER